MSQGHGPHSVGLTGEFAEASLGGKNPITRKNVVLNYYAGTCTWYVCSRLFKPGPAMPLKTHVVAPSSTNSERLTARRAREDLVIFCACTEPIGIDIGAVCVERGRPKWPTTMLTDADKETYRENRKKGNLHASHDPL